MDTMKAEHADADDIRGCFELAEAQKKREKLAIDFGWKANYGMGVGKEEGERRRREAMEEAEARGFVAKKSAEQKLQDERAKIHCAMLRKEIGDDQWQREVRGVLNARAYERIPGAELKLRVGRTSEREENLEGPYSERASALINTVYKGVEGKKVIGPKFDPLNPSGGSKRRRQSRKKLSKKIRARNVKKTNRKLKKRGKTHRKRIIKTIGNKK